MKRAKEPRVGALHQPRTCSCIIKNCDFLNNLKLRLLSVVLLAQPYTSTTSTLVAQTFAPDLTTLHTTVPRAQRWERERRQPRNRRVQRRCANRCCTRLPLLTAIAEGEAPHDIPVPLLQPRELGRCDHRSQVGRWEPSLQSLWADIPNHDQLCVPVRLFAVTMC